MSVPVTRVCDFEPRLKESDMPVLGDAPPEFLIRVKPGIGHAGSENDPVRFFF